jgi:hypothetical protein
VDHAGKMHDNQIPARRPIPPIGNGWEVRWSGLVQIAVFHICRLYGLELIMSEYTTISIKPEQKDKVTPLNKYEESIGETIVRLAEFYEENSDE